MELGADELHVWYVKLAGCGETVAAFEKILSTAERESCHRFYHDVHRRAYALSHGVLRLLLARYLGAPAREIALRYGHAGKPALDHPGAALEFNMSHSGDLAVYAFAIGCPVGVDVEQVRPMPDLESVAAHFFAGEECADLLALSPADRTEAFFRCWTRKEAYIKATGEGISAALKSFRVSLRADEPAALRHTAQGSDHAWQIEHLEPAPGYLGAVAYEGVRRRLRQWPLTAADRVEASLLVL